MKGRIRLALAAVAALAVLLPLGYLWQDSRLPSSYSVMDMGYVDAGGGSADTHAMHGSDISVTDLREDGVRPADVSVDLEARRERFQLASGETVDGYTFNGSSPGPTIEATVGDLVEVRVHNASVPEGITVHWHGVDVPNGEDGVAGVTQDAIGQGESFTYRFVVDDAGTYWYHSHQVSHREVLRGLFGALVVHPPASSHGLEVTAVAHTYAGVRTLNGSSRDLVVDAPSGSRVRVRVVNTDVGTVETWADGPFRVLAVDGRDLNHPTPVEGRRLGVPAGGRADLEVTAPARLQVGSTAVLVGTDAAEPEEPGQNLDLLTYGEPAALPFDPSSPDREFDYSIGRRPGFVDGRPGLWWSINGHLWPDVPMFLVSEGDVVVFHIANHSGVSHPMHLHGHHAVVLARDGKRATGSPWWVDSLDVADGESYDIAFVADNPGIWMDHCHNLAHAAQGLVAHLMYSGVTTPYRLGDDSGNDPE